MHSQTAKLVARIAENLPDMDSGLMQSWIDNPRGLKKTLAAALCPPVAEPKIDYINLSPELEERFRQANLDQGQVLQPVYTLSRKMSQAQIRQESGAVHCTPADILTTIHSGQLGEESALFLMEDCILHTFCLTRGYWFVDDYPANCPVSWYTSIRVFSRNYGDTLVA